MDQHDVLRFDISMQNLMPVHEGNGIEKVADDERGALLAEFLAAGNEVVELAVAAELESGVEVVFVGEAAVGFDDVGVVQETLDFELPDELHQKVVLDYLALLHHLQGHYHPRVNLYCQVHCAKFTLP